MPLATLAGNAASPPPQVPAKAAWVASWQASPQPVWGDGFLFPTGLPASLQDRTVRQVARLSLGGGRLRLVFSNAYGTEPLRLGSATVARPAAASGALIPGSLRSLSFGGQPGATVPPGAFVVSDPVALPLPALAAISVSFHLPDATPVRSFHWDGRQTTWLLPGEQTQAMAPSTSDAQSTTARPLLSAVQVENTQAAGAVAVMGDSITDGATASLDQDHRWPDYLAARLAPHGVAVVNAGISGARLLSDGMGANALARLDRDVLAQPGVRSLVVLLGINDIAWPGTAFAPDARRPGLAELSAGLRQLVAQAHGRGVRVVGATLTPFEGALPGTPLADYYNADKDALRQQFNDWIRHGGAFDAVIDFDAALKDPAHPSRLAAAYDSGDRLHPGDAGNRAMADAVDLGTLVPGLSENPARETALRP
ncbi:SGNH/GDSL hydrolase family protein [Xylophilus rhododendri]|uniref:SGNH/GDSL hydrolase family protein n=2 Tax=Xylophilus rhododendri TaxID=2697032 RepID=A0A857JE23_9BURK|nr:SGNH/GDSL hydrolase family protein [Xylophilus rhododendri]QHJ01444.1 SGNH/GDSL hydrolase family protein [Xylophilus rhododendri]